MLSALVELQKLDSAADAARRRAVEIPSAEQAIAQAVDAARAAAETVKTAMQANQTARRALEKDIAAVDTRLARFDDHKAAVKTNHEYTALLHEISIAKGEKDGLEDKLLALMEQSDTQAAELKAAQAAVAAEEAKAASARKALERERATLDAELARLADERRRTATDVDARTLGLYEQLIKGRRGIAVARMTGEICGACHVRLRPHVAQQIRRNDSIVQCDSCQRMLYWIAETA